MAVRVMRMRQPLVVMVGIGAVLLGALALVACTKEDQPLLTFAPVEPQATIGCDMHVEPPAQMSKSPSPSSGRATIGNGAKIEFDTDTQPSKSREGEPTFWLWKAPTGLSADSDVVVSVDPEQRNLARLNFSNIETFSEMPSAVRFVACSSDEPLFSGVGTVAPETGWSGGIMTRVPTICLRLRLEDKVAKSWHQLEIPLGEPCSKHSS